VLGEFDLCNYLIDLRNSHVLVDLLGTVSIKLAGLSKFLKTIVLLS
jgi:hypothetical protein